MMKLVLVAAFAILVVLADARGVAKRWTKEKRSAFIDNHPLKDALKAHHEEHRIECDHGSDDHVEDLMNFAKTQAQIDQLNDQCKGETEFGHNHLSTFSDEEKEQRMGLKPPQEVLEANEDHVFGQLVTIDQIKAKLRQSNAPLSIDWRQKGQVVPAVRDQGQCGSCYSFSASDAIAMHAAIKRNARAEILSTQFNADCMDRGGCNGGWESSVYKGLMAAKTGVPTESEIPYKGKSGAAKQYCNSKYHNAKNPNVTNFDDKQQIYYDETPIFQQLQKGPVSICLNAGGSGFMNYRNGVLKGSTCRGNRGSYECNHAVILVGYDLNSNPPTYTMRNSWSTRWGDQGYMKMEAGQNTCGLAYHTVIPIVQ